jgi:hypothetical protein
VSLHEHSTVSTTRTPFSNHHNFVAQKHTAVTFSVSSSLARIADAEWARCCESVRKSSPQIGNLGEWRSFCDGGWIGKIPDDLPDVDSPVATGPLLATLPAVEEGLNSDTDTGVNRIHLTNASRGYIPPNSLPVLHSPTTDSDLSQHVSTTATDGIPALDHFPAPPVHLPPPRLRGVSSDSLDGPLGNPPSYGRRITSPASSIPEPTKFSVTTPTDLATATAAQTPSPTTNAINETFTHFPVLSRSDPLQTSSPTSPQTTILASETTEFGIRQPLPPSGSSGLSSLPKGSPRSSGVVLAMRNRFSPNVSHDLCAYTIQEAELHSPCLQVHREKLQPQSLVYRSASQLSLVDINSVARTLQYVRTGLRWGQPLNLPSMMRLVPMHWWVFHRTTVT